LGYRIFRELRERAWLGPANNECGHIEDRCQDDATKGNTKTIALSEDYTSKQKKQTPAKRNGDPKRNKPWATAKYA